MAASAWMTFKMGKAMGPEAFALPATDLSNYHSPWDLTDQR